MNRVWYRLWINPEDMMRIIKGKNRIKEILDILLWDECQGC